MKQDWITENNGINRSKQENNTGRPRNGFKAGKEAGTNWPENDEETSVLFAGTIASNLAIMPGWRVTDVILIHDPPSGIPGLWEYIRRRWYPDSVRTSKRYP